MAKARSHEHRSESAAPHKGENGANGGKLTAKDYEHELARLHIELVKLQYWVKQQGLRVVLVFEGRDAAGQGRDDQAHHRAAEPARVHGRRARHAVRPREHAVVLPALRRPPAGRGRDRHLRPQLVQPRRRRARDGLLHATSSTASSCAPAPSSSGCSCARGSSCSSTGSRSATPSRSGASSERAQRSRRRWKLSDMDLKSREKWVEFSQAKDEMFFYTDIPEAPWYTVEADDKLRARLNCIAHILEQIEYRDVLPKPMKLPPRSAAATYERPPRDRHAIVPERF